MKKMLCASQNMEAKTLPADVCVFGRLGRLSPAAAYSADSRFDSEMQWWIHVSSIGTYLLKNLKSFNCSPPVLFLCLFLSLSLVTSIHWFERFCSEVTKCLSPQCFSYTGSWLTEICKCCKPHPTRDETRDLQIAPQRRSCFRSFCTSGTQHTRYIRAIFEDQRRPFCSSLFVSFFRCSYERNSIHTASLSHFTRFTTCFIFIQSCTNAEFT